MQAERHDQEEAGDDKGKEEERHEQADTGPANEGKPVVGTGMVNTCVGALHEYIPDLENIPMHPSICSFGKRRSGKSTSIDNWLFHCLQEVPYGIVITRTKSNGFWQTRVHERLVFQGFREDILVALTERQDRMIMKYGKEDPRTFCFCILDDIIADQRQIRHTPALNTFFVEGRHKNITVIITSQNIKGVGPMIRGNCDLLFVQPIYNIKEREALLELVGGSMPRKTWHQLMDEVVFALKLEGHTNREPKLKVQILVVQDFEQTADLTEKFTWWSPVHSSQLPDYRLLSPLYWELCEQEARREKKVPQKSSGRAAHPADLLLKI